MTALIKKLYASDGYVCIFGGYATLVKVGELLFLCGRKSSKRSCKCESIIRYPFCLCGKL